jgi:hypothetical protein
MASYDQAAHILGVFFGIDLLPMCFCNCPKEDSAFEYCDGLSHLHTSPSNKNKQEPTCPVKLNFEGVEYYQLKRAKKYTSAFHSMTADFVPPVSHPALDAIWTVDGFVPVLKPAAMYLITGE